MNGIAENFTKVLPEDRGEFLREIDVSFSCIDEMHQSLLDGDLDDVVLCIKDLQESVLTMKMMFARKERRDRLIALVEDLKSRGIEVDLVSRLTKKAASAGTLTAINN